MNLSFDETKCYNALDKREINDFIKENEQKISDALSGKLGMREMLGWYNVKDNLGEFDKCKALAKEINDSNSCLILVGVGGSNRSAQSLIEGLKKNNAQKVVYGGNNLSSQYFLDLVAKLENRDFYVDIIAKDFHTVEPGIAFRMLRDVMKKRYGEAYKRRVILTGSFGDEQLYKIAETEGFRFVEFPKAVGGRFTAFTNVTFLPAAVAGVDLDKFVLAGENCQKEILAAKPLDNMAVRYAAIRFLLQKKGYLVENLACFEPHLDFFARWWLQLHGETEGKCEGAVLPMMTNFSEDLHAIGQYLQQGRRFVFETFLNLMNKNELSVAPTDFADGFAYLDGARYDKINESVYGATLKAHSEDGVPCLQFAADSISESTFAELMYVNMMSTYVSSVLLGVEPFDQPGVENYKKNMYAVLKA